jgi:hypothetical protein
VNVNNLTKWLTSCTPAASKMQDVHPCTHALHCCHLLSTIDLLEDWLYVVDVVDVVDTGPVLTKCYVECARGQGGNRRKMFATE